MSDQFYKFEIKRELTKQKEIDLKLAETELKILQARLKLSALPAENVPVPSYLESTRNTREVSKK